ncbi:MAG: NUDIX hydrolase [Candidatus Levybacteria bacterium]|nr:NUDIX hydrolase [Candidatus Levybacteria bacterium]
MNDNISSDRIFEIGVKALLYSTPGKYLFLKRAKPYLNNSIRKWDIPGGRVLPGEELLKGLKREVKEETGLGIKKIDRILTAQDILRVPTKHTVRITYLAKCLEGEVVIDKKEHCDYQWLTLNQVKKLRTDIYLKPVIKELLLRSF